MRRSLLGALLGALAGLALPLTSTAGITSPPGLRVTVAPGAAMNGAAETQEASQGPLQGAASNAVGGSSGSATVDYGSARAETSTTVDASVAGGALCFSSHCSFADVAWADILTFTAPGVPNGQTGSFTAQIAIFGALSGVFPPEFTEVGAFIFSDYLVNVSLDGAFESVRATCFPLPGQACTFNATRVEGIPPIATEVLPVPFDTFTFGPYDFTYGQPFDIEVRVQVNTSVAVGLNTQGVASARSDFSNTVDFVGVLQVFDGPDGSGSPVPLKDVVASTASGSDWLQTVPEPTADIQRVGALLALGIVAARQRRSRTGTVLPLLGGPHPA